MDQRTQPGQVSRQPETARVEEGVSRPQPQLPATNRKPSEEAVLEAGRAPTDSGAFTWNELRQSPRIRCSGSVEFRTEGSEEHQWGTLTDISLRGCYAEMNNTFPIGTNVYLVLKSFGARIQTRGIVRTSFPSLGMGIAFAEMEPGQHQHLKLLLDALTGSSTVPRAGLAREIGTKEALGQVDPIAFLDEITEFFRKKQLLSREEFQQIAKLVRRL